VCKKVPAEVVPQLGIPTGFSPNGDGQNDILYVRGAAIKTMDLKIYNRWGQLIFQTNTQEVGWDGTYNGQPQPMEAYGYVLTATFIDGTNRTLKGNITLLR
jgi:gliding motility-associated-like protein